MHLIICTSHRNLQITSFYKKMEKLPANSFCLLACVLVLFLSSVLAVTDDPQDKQVYIVYMGSLPSGLEYSPMSHHVSILQEITGESSIDGRLLRSYKRSFNGFAARLSEPEREKIAEMEGVVSVFRSKKLQIQTTASWDFMGLKEGKNTKRNLAVESDTIIGLIDTGIWPESESFSDKGFGPPPKKWKGVCSGGKNFTCNNKLIGARDYTREGTRDLDGHGSHTSSIAAGNAVSGASFFGIGNGTARGGVPAARIAAYKVCTSTECGSEAVLSAFDDAIADGVDFISISIGGGGAARRYEEDTTAIGAFHAMAKGILTVNSAGNSGPKPTSVGSVAPWILTVGASTTNREFLTKVVIQNGKTLSGRSVNAFDLQGKNYPLVFQGSEAMGKILVSVYSFSSDVAVATITKDYKNYATISSRPLSALSPDDFDFLVSYVNSTKSTQGTVLKTEADFNQKAPKVASFSSRGPNTIAVDLLKPDITAPGVEILAAYSPLGSPTEDIDQRHVKYSVLSGTSMSCPHVTGVAAYIKTFHPDWSPAVIQSAIMTTAWSMNASDTGVASTEFAYGAGHVDPIAALNPGLVYELDKADHITFLCGLNYTSKTLKLITGEAVTCTGNTLPRNLNYPSMSAKLSKTNSSFTISFNRTVTNVGTPTSTYKSQIVLNQGTKLSVKVSPDVLFMKSVNEKQSFTVTVSGDNIDPNLPSSASLIWSDGTHNVRSPIVVYTDVPNDSI
ncbi:subtilisin-like protease SBT4.8 [Brassica napus]|nr:subtilisin-like protease SBT4.8 [Brassica napus]